MKFVQHITFTTKRFDEFLKIATEPDPGAPGNPSYQILKDRDHPDTYVATVVFDSYEDAMKNNDRPETQEFAAKMAELTDDAPGWGNFDLVFED
jgi:quinol monooxygenase YgiN